MVSSFKKERKWTLQALKFFCLYRIANALNFPLSVETVCVFTAPVFSAFAAWSAFLLTREVKGNGAGLISATFVAVVFLFLFLEGTAKFLPLLFFGPNFPFWGDFRFPPTSLDLSLEVTIMRGWQFLLSFLHFSSMSRSGILILMSISLQIPNYLNPFFKDLFNFIGPFYVCSKCWFEIEFWFGFEPGFEFEFECEFVFEQTLNTGSLLYATATAGAYFYMVMSWGGYTFIINLIPIHVLLCIITGRFSARLYVAFAPLVPSWKLPNLQIFLHLIGFVFRGFSNTYFHLYTFFPDCTWYCTCSHSASCWLQCSYDFRALWRIFGKIFFFSFSAWISFIWFFPLVFLLFSPKFSSPPSVISL